MRPLPAIVLTASALVLLWWLAPNASDEPARTGPQPARSAADLEREVFRPPAGEAVKGVVLVIHGGGWRGGQDRLMDAIEPDARRLARWGYVAWSVDYRSGRYSVADVIGWYRLIRSRYPRRPVCAKGTSAGGHLALMLAARTRIPCVIDESGPTDLLRFDFRTVARFFPTPRARRVFSPLGYAETNAFGGTEILIAHLRGDELVPFAQSRRFHRAIDSRLVALPAGTVPFVHGRADRLALARYRRIERRFLAASMRRGS
jgi:dipeptidyl aminopeptidase/acylaminoacyl peptidase